MVGLAQRRQRRENLEQRAEKNGQTECEALAQGDREVFKGLSGQVVASRLSFGKMSLESGCTGAGLEARLEAGMPVGRLIIRECVKR